ncbi:MAG TPA: hypothetical protein VF577_08710, partial [Allosphingosinicella sp.]
MVAVISGNGVGLERSSAWVLGSRGQVGAATHGRSTEDVFVNAANGNLVITDTDEFLIGRGVDASIARTYNSQGGWDGDNDDYWRAGVYRKLDGIPAAGNYGAAGSTIKRIDWDGSESVYTWNAAEAAYVSTDGAGAYDKLTLAGTVWTWEDGSSRVTESYAGGTGRLLSTSNAGQTSLTYTYSAAGLITKVANSNGEATELVYDAVNTSQLKQVSVRSSDNSLSTRISYEYDSNDRLESVTVDHTPTSNAADGQSYVTSYGYSGTSRLVSSIGQADGTLLGITYAFVGGKYRVATLTQTVSTGITRVTSFDYSLPKQTKVTDPAGATTILTYDDKDQLIQISYPQAAPGAAERTVSFTYTATGDVLTVSDGPGNTVTYTYDEHGNVEEEVDSAGNMISRNYDGENQLLTETRYAAPDPDGSGTGTAAGPMTSRYAYDDLGRLRYAVSAEGLVTRYDYNGYDQRTATIEFAGHRYDLTGLWASPIDDTVLDSWVSAIADKSSARRTETTYDFRGNVSTVSSYEKLNADGSFNTGSQQSKTTYVYDQRGNLLTRKAFDSVVSEVFVYDGLDRQTVVTDLHGGVTHTHFMDALGQTVVTHDNGLSQVSTYNRAGELIAHSQSHAGGNLVALTGWPTNPSTPSTSAIVDGWQNSVTYTAETEWATITLPDGTRGPAIKAAQTGAGTVGGGNFTNEAEIDVSKSYEFTYYFQINEAGNHNINFGLSASWAATAYVEAPNGSEWTDDTNPYFFISQANQQGIYTANKWYKVVGYVLASDAGLPTGTLGGVYDASSGAKVADAKTFRWNPERAVTTVHSRFFNTGGTGATGPVTYFHKPEIRQVTAPAGTGEISAVSLYRYDAAGRLRLTIDPTGQRSHILYDGSGRKKADIDADGSVAEYRYDQSNNLTSTTRYATRFSAAQLAALLDSNGNPTTAAFVPPAAHADDRWEWHVYDSAQRLVQTIDGTGATTVFKYDGASRLTSTTSYSNRISAAAITSLKAAALTPNLWASPENGGAWPKQNLVAENAWQVIHGQSAWKLTAGTSGEMPLIYPSIAAVEAGTTISATISLKAVDSVTTHDFGILGSASGWGASADSTAVIISGPGTLTRVNGGLWRISGASTTQPTRIAVTRTFKGEAETATTRFYVGTSATILAGAKVILAAPVLLKTTASTVHLPTADGALDRTNREFYDDDGRSIGTLDAEGYLTQTLYDHGGKKVRTIAYANATLVGQRATGSFAQLRTGISPSSKDIHNHFVYDARGLLRATIDGEGNLTRYTYSEQGDLEKTTTGEKVDASALGTKGPALANAVALSAWPANPASLPSGEATVTGWQNSNTLVDETGWISMVGPTGTQVAAIRATRLEPGTLGGGNTTNDVAIDGSKAYQFTYYFKLNATGHHNINFGLSAWGATALVEQ